MARFILSPFRRRLYRGLRFPRLGFEIFGGLSGGVYVAALPVGLPRRLL